MTQPNENQYLRTAFDPVFSILIRTRQKDDDDIDACLRREMGTLMSLPACLRAMAKTRCFDIRAPDLASSRFTLFIFAVSVVEEDSAVVSEFGDSLWSWMWIAVFVVRGEQVGGCETGRGGDVVR